MRERDELKETNKQLLAEKEALESERMNFLAENNSNKDLPQQQQQPQIKQQQAIQQQEPQLQVDINQQDMQPLAANPQM